jgi:hypothetical protein
MSRTKISGEVSPDYVRIFDYDRYSYLIGGRVPAGLALYDYYSMQNLVLKVIGDVFYGFDHETAAYFSGEVHRSTIIFFDFQTAKNFKYAI